MIFFALLPHDHGTPVIPQGWLIRREGNTGFFSLYAGRRSPENCLVLEVLGEVRGMFLVRVSVSDEALRVARPLLSQVPFFSTLEELRDPSHGPEDDQWQMLASDIVDAFPDRRVRDDRGELVDPDEPLIDVRSAIAGEDIEEGIASATRERAERPTEVPGLVNRPINRGPER